MIDLEDSLVIISVCHTFLNFGIPSLGFRLLEILSSCRLSLIKPRGCVAGMDSFYACYELLHVTLSRSGYSGPSSARLSAVLMPETTVLQNVSF